MDLLLIGLATLVSEDLTCIATGVLVAQGRLGFWAGTLACLSGIYAGDLALFLTGRLAGRAALKWRPFQRFVPAAQVARASAWISKRGLAVVFLSRFAPGLRLPTYFVAGLLKTDSRRFAWYFLAAAAAWTPLLVGLSAAFGESFAQFARLRAGGAPAEFAAIFAAAVGLRRSVKWLASFRVRRRMLGVLRRSVRWEFWPAWAAYLPVLPYILWLGLKHRSLTLFTAANPGIPSGGFVGESKSDILRHLDACEDSVAKFRLIPAALDVPARTQRALEFMERHSLDFPVVLKPDLGERGSGVAVVRSQEELAGYLAQAWGNTIVQEHIPGMEFGIFYYRCPGDAEGRISSITQKSFPEVTGDGQSSIAELVLRDSRAVCLAGTYFRQSRRPVEEVPARGEVVRLVEIGSHCRGAVFVDARHLNTRALERAIDRTSKRHPGFYFGRYDVRTPSAAALQEGRFKVIELNGVSAEATHIYDPAVSIREAYRVLFEQWQIAFEIGRLNRECGARETGVLELVRVIRARAGKARGQTCAAPKLSPAALE